MNKRTLKAAGLSLVTAAGFGAAVLVGVALARTFTLNDASGAKVTNQQMMTTHEAIAVGPKKHAVYDLTGDSKSHPECTAANGCFTFWAPLKVPSGKTPTKAPGIKGKLSLWHRDGFAQVLLSGHPLYYFVGDAMADDATGEGIVSFGGTWHVWKALSGSPAGGTGSTMSTSTMTTPCIPYPGYPCP